jgi:hypothetical protein
MDRRTTPDRRDLTVSVYGAGQLGGGVSRILASRHGYEVRGPYGRHDRQQALTSGADVVVIATTSFLDQVAPDIEEAVEAGSNVIASAEECAYPWAVDLDVAQALDARARERQVTIVGAGVNPGFAFDALVLVASGAAPDVADIRVERVVNISGFSAAILGRLGVGYELADFARGVDDGRVHGHIGFPQSMRVVADALGVTLDRIDRHLEPVVADRDYEAAHLSIPAGRTAGFRQSYTGVVAGREWFRCVFFGHVDLGAVGETPRDIIDIGGTTPLHFTIEPGLNPQSGSSAVIANSIRRVAAAAPGWVTVADLTCALPT